MDIVTIKMKAARDGEIQLVEAANRRDFQQVQQSLTNDPQSIDPQYWKTAIIVAEDFPEILDILFKYLSSTTMCSDVIYSLINRCASETFKRAVGHFSHHQISDMFNSSIYEKSLKLCNWMLTHIPFEFKGEMLVSCVETRNLNLLNKIISQVDARFENSWALRTAADNSWEEGVDALWNVSDPTAALTFMKNQLYMTSEDYQMIEQRLAAEQQHQNISKELNVIVTQNIKRKM